MVKEFRFPEKINSIEQGGIQKYQIPDDTVRRENIDEEFDNTITDLETIEDVVNASKDVWDRAQAITADLKFEAERISGLIEKYQLSLDMQSNIDQVPINQQDIQNTIDTLNLAPDAVSQFNAIKSNFDNINGIKTILNSDNQDVNQFSAIVQTADEIDNVVAKLNTTDETLWYSSIKQTADEIDSVVVKLNSDNRATGQFSAITQTADEIDSIVGTLNSDNKATGQYSAIVQTANQIDTVVANLNSAPDADNQYTAISQNAAEIKLRAYQSDLDVANNNISTNATNISINADKIASLVQRIEHTTVTTGTISSATTNTITDTTKDFVSLGIKPGFLIEITSGNNEKEIRNISSVSTDTLTVSENWTATPSSGDGYQVSSVSTITASAITQRANEITSVVQTLNSDNQAAEQFSAIVQTADEIDSVVATLNLGPNDATQYSSIKQNATEISSIVGTLNSDNQATGQFSSIKQTADEIDNVVAILNSDNQAVDQYSSIKQTADEIDSVVADLNIADPSQSTFSSIKQNATEIQSIVSTLALSPDDANQFSSIKQNAQQIDLRVKSDEVINSINLSPEGVQIQGNKIKLGEGLTVDANGNVIVGNLDASKITTGTLDAARVTVGVNTTFESGYDPSTKETPSGAQAKADTAEANAKAYANPTKPEGAHLFHFDRSLISTDGIKPEGTPVVTMRPNEGKFGGAVAVEEGTTNLVPNPSFESGIWANICLGDTGDGSVSITNLDSWHGVQCLEIDVGTATNYVYSRSDYFAIDPTLPITITAKIKVLETPSNRATISYFAYDSGGTVLGGWAGAATIDKTKLGEWQTHEQVIPANSLPTNTTQLRVMAIIYTNNGAGKARFDAVQVEQKPFATSFVDGTRADGKLDYQTDLNLLQSGFIHFVVNSEKAMTDHDLCRNGALIDICHGSVRQLDMWMREAGIEFFVNNSRKSTISYNKNTNYTIDITWSNGGNPKFYLNGNLEYDGTGIDTFTDAGNGLVRLGRYMNGFVNSVLFDEFMYGNYCPTAEEIQAWYNSNAPFYDAEPVQSAGDIITGSFGTKITGEKGIEIIDSEGNKSILNSNHLAFYKAGFDIPHWYSRRVAYGVAQDGDYIDLAGVTGIPWDKAPKVITAIKALQTYEPSQPDSPQEYTSYPSSIDQNGFYVYGYSRIPAARGEITDTGDSVSGDQTPATLYTGYSRSNATRIEITIGGGTNYNYSTYEYRIGWDVDVYYQVEGGPWILRKSIVGYTSYSTRPKGWSSTCSVSGLTPGKYRWKAVVNDLWWQGKNTSIQHHNDNAGSCYFSDFYDWAEEIIDNGEVMWIAIEGGAD